MRHNKSITSNYEPAGLYVVLHSGRIILTQRGRFVRNIMLALVFGFLTIDLLHNFTLWAITAVQANVCR